MKPISTDTYGFNKLKRIKSLSVKARVDAAQASLDPDFPYYAVSPPQSFIKSLALQNSRDFTASIKAGEEAVRVGW
jgi:hypothetical protein